MSVSVSVSGKIKYIFLNFIGLLAVTFITLSAINQLTVSTELFDNDYKTFYKSLRHENPPYQFYQYQRNHNTPITAINMNTPAMNVILKAIVNLSHDLRVNTFVWVTLSLLCAGISISILLRFLNGASENAYFPLFLALLWLSWPSLYDLKLGQVGYFLLPILSVAFFCYSKQYQKTAAILLALLASLKLFFLIFVLLFFLQCQWRLLGLFLFSFLIFTFAPLLIFNSIDYHAFLSILQSSAIIDSRTVFPMNGSIMGVLTNTANFLGKESVLGIRIATLVISAYFIIRWMIFDVQKSRLLPAFSNELRFSFLIILALLCSPLGWMYYFLYLLVPIFVFLKISARYQLSTIFFIFFAIALFVPYLGWMGRNVGVLHIVEHYACFVMLLCFLICLASATRAVIREKSAFIWQPRIIVAVLVTHVLINLILLNFNYGMPYFSTLDKSNYLNSMPSAVWVGN